MDRGAFQAARVIEVRGPSHRSETGKVFFASIAIVLFTLGTIWVRRSDARGDLEGGGLLAWQRSFRDLAPNDQRAFMALREGLAEAENVRASSLVWSSVEVLADKGVPPFARDPIDAGAYRWTFRREKNVVNYLGLPREGSDRSAFLLLVVEPTEEEMNGSEVTLERPPEPDENNHILTDGTLIHVSTWMKAKGASSTAIIGGPEREGWTQIVVGGRS